MTRYARAKGSKASNERIPEPATPWSEIKQQLLEKKKEEDTKEKREEINAQRLDNYKKFLDEHNVKESKKTKWAEFPGIEKPQKESKLKKKKTIEKLRKGADALVNGNDGTNKVGKKDKNKKLDRIVDEEFNKLKVKLDKIFDEVEFHETQGSDNEPPEELSSKVELPEINAKKAKQKKKKLKILSNTEKDLNENHLDGDSKSNSNEASDRQIGKETIESETNHEKKKKKKRPVLEDKSCTQAEDGPVKKKSKKSSKNNQTTENEELGKGPIKNKSKITLGKKENKLQIGEGNIKDIHNTEQDAEILKMKLARKERKKKRQWEKRQLKKAQKQAEKESQNTDVVKGIDKNLSDQQNFSKNQKQSNGHRSDSINENEINNLKNKSKFSKNHNQLHNNISKPASKEHRTKTRLDGADVATAAKKKKITAEKSRRKPLGPETMTINGQNVEIELVDGFPVKKEDAVRLKQLRKQMISKGLPRSEIDKALKLERRRAEKALARLKRVVCFNCRKSGHNLSECPEVGKDELAQSMATDICFKCGSTEHRSFECKVVRGDNFKHATCFICKEQGHISRQCPDNPRGLYPKGGACKVCGDVTHLKKDCPQYQASQQQQGGVKVDVINENNLEDLGEGNDKTVVKKRVNKIIKF